MTNLSTFLGPNQAETNVKLATNCDIGKKSLRLTMKLKAILSPTSLLFHSKYKGGQGI
jgi:hypothetical protein